MKIPTSWVDITLDQFMEIQHLDKSDELDYLVSLISVICRTDVDTVEAMTLPELRAIGSKLSFMQTLPTKFVNDFKVDGEKYFVECNIAHFSAGQYIDLSKYIELGAEDNLHKIMSLFCVPMKRKLFRWKAVEYGKGYDTNAVAEAMKKSPVSVAYPLSLFFCNLLNKSMPVIQNSLKKEMESLNRMIVDKAKSAKPLSNTGDGSQSSTIWQTTTALNGTTSLK